MFLGGFGEINYLAKLSLEFFNSFLAFGFIYIRHINSSPTTKNFPRQSDSNKKADHILEPVVFSYYCKSLLVIKGFMKKNLHVSI